jgi:hypothetical protein
MSQPALSLQRNDAASAISIPPVLAIMASHSLRKGLWNVMELSLAQTVLAAPAYSARMPRRSDHDQAANSIQS